MKTRRHQSNRLEWIVMIILLLASFGCLKCCHGQAVPAYPAPQTYPGPAWIVPKPVRFPWIRYQVLGWPAPMQVVTPIGQPFQATVYPVAPVGVVR